MWISSSAIGFEHQIAIDDDTDREARPDRQRRLDIEVAAEHLPARLVDAGAAADGLDDVAVGATRCGAGTELAPHAEQGREQRRPEQSPPVIVNFILEAGI